VLCHNREELESEYEYSRHESRGGAVIVEEYLQGPEFSIEVMVVDGEPHILQITDKLTTGAPHFVEMGHSQPTGQNKENREKIRDLAVRACKAVGINTGPAHVEMIITENGPKMVELGARMGGDCITTHLVPLSTGIDMVGCTIKQACGEKIDIEPKYNKGSAIRYFDAHDGLIKRIEGISEAEKIDGIKEISIVHSVGEKIGEIGSSTDRVGFVIAQADTADEAVKRCDLAMDRVHIMIEK
jgi:biotin carboxylase